MSRRLITLTTDFGTADHFVGTMKGVIHAIAPAAQVVDITHEITPYEINEAGFVISQAWRFFPKRTIHVAVVDPGVGSSRRPILVEAGGHYFVGPDNGVFTMIYASEEKPKVRQISNRKLALRDISRTFHGRDVFAPAAAHLAKGVPAARFGKPISDYARSFLMTPQQIARRVWSGVILKVDRFGNLITNFRIEEFPDFQTYPFELRVGVAAVRRLALNYAETGIGELFAIVGSSGYVEVAVNQGSAARHLGCGAGAPVELEFWYD